MFSLHVFKHEKMGMDIIYTNTLMNKNTILRKVTFALVTTLYCLIIVEGK